MFLLSPEGAYEHAETGLLEYVDVVVVGVAHGPAAGVSSGVLTVPAVHTPAVTSRPQAETVRAGRLGTHVVEMSGLVPDPPENCHLTVKKLPKT